MYVDVVKRRRRKDREKARGESTGRKDREKGPGERVERMYGEKAEKAKLKDGGQWRVAHGKLYGRRGTLGPAVTPRQRY